MELNEFIRSFNKDSKIKMVSLQDVLSNKIGDENENQSDIKLLYDFRIKKIITTFADIDNDEHYAIQVKRKNEENWITAAWCDDEDSALTHINDTIREKYPSWIEKCVFGMFEFSCKQFKYL